MAILVLRQVEVQLILAQCECRSPFWFYYYRCTYKRKSGYSYAFDVDPKTQTFLNRRVLAYIDAGIPDGIQLDTNGNIYTSTADGVQVRTLTSSHLITTWSD